MGSWIYRNDQSTIQVLERYIYIINVTDYLTHWVDVEPVCNFSTDIAARFIFENIIIRFCCPRSLNSDHGAHFINETVVTLTREFLIQNHKSSPHHRQANGTVEAFNKIHKRGLNKVFCTNREDWDDRVPTMLWDYSTTTKKLHNYTPFQLVYGSEEIVLVEFITPSLYIVHITHMKNDESVAEWVTKLLALDEARFLVNFHQTMEKDLYKS